MIEQYLLPPNKNSFTSYGNTLDLSGLVALSDPDFALAYLELMSQYRDKDGWWTKDKIPHCGSCHAIIPGPEALRRYHGQTLDSACFKKVYEADNTHRTDVEKLYWNRVAQLK